MYRLLTFAVLCCCLAEAVCAVEVSSTIKSVKIGIEDTYKNGLWTPIIIENSESIENIAIRCSDSDGTPMTYHYTTLVETLLEDAVQRMLPNSDSGFVNGTQKITVLAKLGRKDEPLQVSVNDSEFTSFNVPSPISPERPIYLIFGSDDIGLQNAVAELMLREERRPLLVRVNSIADLPTEWFGYEAIEMVVMTTSEPQIFEDITAESSQIKALDNWLKLGGKMLLCAGKDAEQFLENENGFLRLFLPGKYDGMTEMRSGTTLERFVNSNRQIFMNGTNEAPFMKMPRLAESQGITFLEDGDLPLILRAAHGLGTVIYFAGDLSERPLKNWRDRTTLVRNIMQWDRTQERVTQTPRSGAMLQLGYNDIAGQIRSALDQFEGVRIMPFSVILIILAAYWLVIGLFDWFFVHKILKRPILTWVTFPLWIVLFSLLIYGLAASRQSTLDESDFMIVNGLEVYDVDYETDTKRTSVWQGWYSQTDQYFSNETFTHPSIPDSDRDKSAYLSWNGLPGSGLGGMAPKTVSPTIWQVGSEHRAYSKIECVPIQTRSTKSFFGQSNRFLHDRNYRIHPQLSDEEGIPVGTINIPDDFSYSLKNSILIYGRWMLDLGEIQRGQTITVTKTTPRRDLRDLLIPSNVLGDTNLHVFASYNPQSADLEYIARVMSLHRALGGYESIGLHHAYMPSLDLSGLLTADRALLIGTVMSSEVDDLHQTVIFRHSLPIALTESSPRWRGERYELKEDALEEKVQPGWIKHPQ